jgi:hypothetical protein
VDPHLLNFRRFIKDPLTDNNIIKADILAVKFFPKAKIADLSNINPEAIIKQRVLNISPIV